MNPREVRKEIDHVWLVKEPKPQVPKNSKYLHLIPLPFDTQKYCFMPLWNKTQKSVLMGASPAALGGTDGRGIQAKAADD